MKSEIVLSSATGEEPEATNAELGAMTFEALPAPKSHPTREEWLGYLTALICCTEKVITLNDRELAAKIVTPDDFENYFDLMDELGRAANKLEAARDFAHAGFARLHVVLCRWTEAEAREGGAS